MCTLSRVRPVLALAVAYAVALQALMLVAVDPFGGANAWSASPICAAAGGGGSAPQPAGHAHDCLASCLVGCCGAPALPACESRMVHADVTGPVLAAATVAAVGARPSVTGSHRSRAPPLS